MLNFAHFCLKKCDSVFSRVEVWYWVKTMLLFLQVLSFLCSFFVETWNRLGEKILWYLIGDWQLQENWDFLTSSCQVGRTSWGWGGRRVRRIESSAPLVSRWWTMLWRSPAAIKSLYSQSQVADCSLQPVAPLTLVGICSFPEAPTYVHQCSTAIQQMRFFVSYGDRMAGINTELLMGMHFYTLLFNYIS